MVNSSNHETGAVTLRNREEGCIKLNAQAALPIRMVAQFPDMVEQLEMV